MKDWLDEGLLFLLFKRLRQNGPELDLRQYELLLKALRTGVGSEEDGSYTKTGFRELCKTLWLTRAHFSHTFDRIFDESLQQLLNGWAPEVKETTKETKTSTTDTPTSPSDSIHPQVKEEVPPLPPAESTPPPTDLPRGEKENYREWEVAFEASDGETPDRIGMAADAPDHTFIYSDHYLPFSPRHLQQQCRYLRYKAEKRPSQSIDVAATIRATARTGGFPKLLFAQERYYTESFYLLVDRSSGMAAFDKLADVFVQSFRQGLGKTDEENLRVYYFDELPDHWVYKDPALRVSRNWTAIQEELSKDDFVFVLSDAGAARQRESEARHERTVAWVQTLKQQTEHLLWLNPMPADRWVGSTAFYLPLLTHCMPLNAGAMLRLPGILRHL